MGKVSFFEKKDSICPICEHNFRTENFMTGGGRMNAGSLGKDLRRQWLPSKKFGEVFPLVYYANTCPNCYYSALNHEFLKPDPKAIQGIQKTLEDRKNSVKTIFPELDFTMPRTLKEGAASYILAIHSYQHWTGLHAPSLKSGICALRASWIFHDLHHQFPKENYDYLELILRTKAKYFYSIAIDRETTGKESIGGVTNFGPDIDNNWGYDGVLYLSGLLEFTLGDASDETERLKKLERARMVVARLVGMGKSSKSKPSAILEMAKELYHEMGAEIKE